LEREEQMACKMFALAVSGLLLGALAPPSHGWAGDSPAVFSQRVLVVMDTAPGRFAAPPASSGIEPRQSTPVRKAGFRHAIGECMSCHGG
jgi:hypothetical protein